MKPIGKLFGARVEMTYGDDIRIVLRWRLGEANQAALAGLGQALGGFARMSASNGEGVAEIIYDGQLDRRLMTLIDLLISVRYAHPRMVQLPLALTDDEARELAEVMGEQPATS